MQERVERATQLLSRNDLTAAECEIRSLLAEAPNEAIAHNLLGLVHVARQEYAEALASFRKAIQLRTPYPEAYVNFAIVCNRAGDHELAIEACRRALAEAPDDSLARVHMGLAHQAMGRPAEARRAFEEAAPDPLALYHLGHLLLEADDLAVGLPLLEARRKRGRNAAAAAGKPWKGDARPEASLRVLAEDHLGDVILMSRFFPALADRFAKVVVQVPEPLVRLVASIDERLEVVADPGGTRCDLWAPVMSLPLLLGIKHLADVPTRPWISVDAPGSPEGRARIGINWAGDPAHAHDATCSGSLDDFAPLLSIEEIDWVSLHRGTREAEAERYGLETPLAGARDFLDTARELAQLDMVVTTDSAVANLAAAMGVPTCVMTPPNPNWRWRSWYEGVTICAQLSPGNWYGPIAGVAGALLERMTPQEAKAAA